MTLGGDETTFLVAAAPELLTLLDVSGKGLGRACAYSGTGGTLSCRRFKGLVTKGPSDNELVARDDVDGKGGAALKGLGRGRGARWGLVRVREGCCEDSPLCSMVVRPSADPQSRT